MDSTGEAKTEDMTLQQQLDEINKRIEGYQKNIDKLKAFAGRRAALLLAKLQVILAEGLLDMEIQFSDLDKLREENYATFAELEQLVSDGDGDQLAAARFQRLDVESIKNEAWRALTEGLATVLAQCEADFPGTGSATGISGGNRVDEANVERDEGAQWKKTIWEFIKEGLSVAIKQGAVRLGMDAVGATSAVVSAAEPEVSVNGASGSQSESDGGAGTTAAKRQGKRQASKPPRKTQTAARKKADANDS